MKRADFKQLKLLVLMALPISFVALAPTFLRDSTGELRRQLPGPWRSADGAGELTLEQGSSAKLAAGFSYRGNVTWAPYIELVDASHIRAYDDGVPGPGILYRVSINGDTMLLDPSDGKDASKVQKWIRIK